MRTPPLGHNYRGRSRAPVTEHIPRPAPNRGRSNGAASDGFRPAANGRQVLGASIHVGGSRFPPQVAGETSDGTRL